MKNIIVFSIWGEDPIYWVGAKKNIELSKQYYPNFICRFYIDKNSDVKLIDSLRGENVEIYLMDSDPNKFKNLTKRFTHSGLFWRFLALIDEDVDIVLSRDCDSRIGKREAYAVDEWMKSGKNFHIMRDHPYHTVPILAGMWGCKSRILKEMGKLLSFWESYQNKGIFQAEDQDFLGQVIYPMVRDQSMEHSEFGINFGGEIRRFPSQRDDREFVGDVFDDNDRRHPEYFKNV